MVATVKQKMDYLQKLVDKFDAEDMANGKYAHAESSVSQVLGALQENQLQITRLVDTHDDGPKLFKWYVAA